MRDDEFYNSNMGRSYPFIDTSGTAIPDWLVVDFRAIITGGAFDPATHVIYLAWIARLADRVRFGFRTDAPELSDQELVFEYDLDAGKMVTQHVVATPITTSLEQRCGCDEELLCNPDFQLPADCGAEMLCDPRVDACGDTLLDKC